MPQEFSRFTRSFAALAGLLVLAGCGGGGSGGTPPGVNPPTTPPPPGPTITVSGRVTFDRLQFQSIVGTGLNAATPVVSPAREVVVEAVTGNAVVATTTDSNGNYSINVPVNSNAFIRVRAQMLKADSAPTWNFTVKNNTGSDAVYVLQGDPFATGSANVTTNLHAPSGWTGSAYNDNGRFAAPFAILDTVYRTKQLILSAAPSAEFPALDLYWSTQNRTDNGIECGDEPGCNDPDPFCPDRGNIGTSFYFSDPGNRTVDDCDNPDQLLPTGIYILGAYGGGAGDTDEFDAHVIAHEFGHYFEDRFSRSDSIGGEHTSGDRLDLRVAFGEGWGNAFGAMSLNDPEYRDSSDGISSDFGFNLETGALETGAMLNEGWYSEASVGEILWDIFDTTPESGDNVTLGFVPIYAVMNNEQVSTDALTSIFSFASALRANNSGQSSAIGTLLQQEAISGTGAFGSGEGNSGGDVSFAGVYREVAIGQPITVCSTTSADGNSAGNKLGNRQFLRFQKDSPGLVTIRADGVTSPGILGSAPAQDPDILVFRRGAPVFPAGVGEGTDVQQEIISQRQLDAGTYVLEVYDFEIVNQDASGSRCMSISISGN